MSLALGARVGPYEITAQIGAGGMGEVYRARDTRLDRSVAIKVLSPRITADPEFLERFDREAHAISQLNHPHICTLHDVGQHEGVPYLVLEYVEGETLAARLARGPLPVEQALAVGIQISDALDKAHRQGIMHRDLKPANVMLVGKSGAAPHAKLLDFGLAKADGGKPVQLGLRGLWPIFLPDGDRFLYVQRPANRRAEEGTPPNLYAASLSSPEGQGVTRVGSNVAYAPPGYLLFLPRVLETTTLMAQPFDPDRMQVRGDPQPLAADIAFTPYGSRGVFSVSATGVLVYLTDPPQDRELVWLDRLGNRLSVVGPPGRYAHPAISPNGDLVAFTRIDAPTGTAHIYLATLARPVPQPFTLGPHRNVAPVFSPEGTRIAFQSNRESQPGLYIKTVDDGKETWISPTITPTDWSRNGDILGERRQRTGGLFTVPASGAAAPKEFLDTEFTELSPSFSPPHGRWVAYMSVETGRPEIYLRRFDGSGRAIPISNGNGGTDPRWRRDGEELFYLAAERDSLMVVDVQAGESIEPGTPRPLFPVNLGSGGDDRPYAVSPNGDRFLMVLPLGNAPPPLTVELNWTARLKR